MTSPVLLLERTICISSLSLSLSVKNYKLKEEIFQEEGKLFYSLKNKEFIEPSKRNIKILSALFKSTFIEFLKKTGSSPIEKIKRKQITRNKRITIFEIKYLLYSLMKSLIILKAIRRKAMVRASDQTSKQNTRSISSSAISSQQISDKNSLRVNKKLP